MTRTCRFAWCTGETTVPARRAGVGTVHEGPACAVEAGDDRVTVRVVGLPGFDDEDTFVELTAMPAGAGSASLLLLGDEVDRLVTALVAARRVAGLAAA